VTVQVVLHVSKKSLTNFNFALPLTYRKARIMRAFCCLYFLTLFAC
jgi:hypothetical protein